MAIQEDFDALLMELGAAEVEEQTDLYRIELHIRSSDDLKIFAPDERKEITALMSRLLLDTKQHARLLGRVTKKLYAYRKELLHDCG